MGDVVDMGAWQVRRGARPRRRHGRAQSERRIETGLVDILEAEGITATDNVTGRVDALLWVRQGLRPAEEAAMVKALLNSRFPDGL